MRMARIAVWLAGLPLKACGLQYLLLGPPQELKLHLHLVSSSGTVIPNLSASSII